MPVLIPANPERAQAQTQAPAAISSRLTSLDAYRGFVMLLILAEVLRLGSVAAARPESGFWRFLAFHQSHVPWVGCSLHDLIQPSFSFLVGMALPFSIASRAARGLSRWRMTLHALWRALALVLLGVFLRSVHGHQTWWTFQDTLSQIGLGYGLLFLLGFRPRRDQWLVLAAVLVGYWAFFALYPLPAPNFDYTKVGVPSDWPNLATGFAAHWNKNSNPAWAFDVWFLNLFPTETRFLYNEGGYATLNCVTTFGTMLLGLIAGGVLRGPTAPWAKVKWLVVAGVIGIVAAEVLGGLGICPVVKRIWTPSWTLFSGGWCLLLTAAFYTVIDIWGWKWWAFPLVVVGMNSIAAYCIDILLRSFIYDNLVIHLGTKVFEVFGAAYEPLVHGGAVVLVSWLLLWWMYRRKIFLRI
jgi:heparan-alpha-glucosaminide N-acetyltransferase